MSPLRRRMIEDMQVRNQPPNAPPSHWLRVSGAADPGNHLTDQSTMALNHRVYVMNCFIIGDRKANILTHF